MPAERGMYPRMRVRDHLVYYARLSGQSTGAAGRTADEWLERLGLADRGGDQVQSLSSGNQQRVQLALALLNTPALLVLDEPFSGLDPIAVETLKAVLREQVDRGAALLLSSHQLDLVADVCTAVVIVDHGRVVLRGDVAQLRAASPRRYVELEFAAPPASDGGRRQRIPVDVESDADRVIAEARARGDLIAYSYSPPDLSEIFMLAVGRDTVEDTDGGRLA
jgi:ABC-2 type transport system ATP-binding protein